MKKLIGIAAAAAVGLGTFGLATSANARPVRVHVAPYYQNGYTWPVRPKVFQPARYVGCYKKVLPARSYGAAFLFAVDRCYLGQSW
jgi:hypothetical protein